LTVVVVVLAEFNPVWSLWEGQTGWVDEGWGVAGFEGFFVVVHLDFAFVVGKTFQVVTGQELLVEVVVFFTAVVAVDVNVVVVEPEGTVQVVVVVVGVDSYVFGVVRKRLFWVDVQVVAGVVSSDGVGVFLLFLLAVHLLVVLGGVDNFGVVEVVGVDFVDWWQDDAVGGWVVQDGDGEGIQEHSLVDVVAGPDGGLVEGFVVLGVVEHSEESDGLFQVFFVEDGEDLVSWKDIIVVIVEELFYYFWFVEMLYVSFGAVGFGDFYVVLVVAWLVDVSEKTKDFLLSLAVMFVGSFEWHLSAVSLVFYGRG